MTYFLNLYLPPQVTIFINQRPVILMRGWIINIDGEKREFLQGETVNTENMVFTFDGMILTGRNDDIGLTIRYFIICQIIGLTQFSRSARELRSEHWPDSLSLCSLSR